MSAIYIEYDGNYHCYVHDGRGHRTRIGPHTGWPSPREAARYADLMDSVERTSPLRDRGEPAHDSPVPPPVEVSDAAGSPGSPRGSHRRQKGRR